MALSGEVEGVLDAAFRDAKQKKHEHLTVEHLLLALLVHAPSLDQLLRHCVVGSAGLATRLIQVVDTSTPPLKEGAVVHVTPGFQRALQRAVSYAQGGRRAVSAADVLMGIVCARQSDAYRLLLEHGLNRAAFFRRIKSQIE